MSPLIGEEFLDSLLLQTVLGSEIYANTLSRTYLYLGSTDPPVRVANNGILGIPYQKHVRPGGHWNPGGGGG